MLSIEKHTINIASEMEAMFVGRIEDIEGKENNESSRTL
jgi:hypothetical protein